MIQIPEKKEDSFLLQPGTIALPKPADEVYGVLYPTSPPVRQVFFEDNEKLLPPLLDS